MEVIAAEKFVSLLRRTAAEKREIDKNPDETLIRHAYDLYLITTERNCNQRILNLIPKIIQNDIEQFGNKHGHFKSDPISEMNTALEYILNHEKYAKRYNNFLNPLVYGSNPPSWSDIKTFLNSTAKEILEKLNIKL